MRFFFFNDTATTEIYTLSLHDALPICVEPQPAPLARQPRDLLVEAQMLWRVEGPGVSPPGPSTRQSIRRPDRKSTRLNSSHGYISYAVFCLKKKKKTSKKTPSIQTSNS